MNAGMIRTTVFALGLFAFLGAGLPRAHALSTPIKQDQIIVEYLDSEGKPLSEMHGYSLEWLGFGAGYPFANKEASLSKEVKLPGHGTAIVNLKVDTKRFEITFKGSSGTLLNKQSCEAFQVSAYVPNFENATFYCGAENSKHAFKVRITNLSAQVRNLSAKMRESEAKQRAALETINEHLNPKVVEIAADGILSRVTTDAPASTSDGE